MRIFLRKIGRGIFKFLSSLKLAVSTLLSLAAILAVGTILESLHDADTARHYVYGTWWFAVVLCLLGLNVLCAALSRWPWQRHHIGFVITHLGIILILIGSLTTLLKGHEGQVVLAEGETARRLTLKEPVLFVFDPASRSLAELPADYRFSPPHPGKPVAATVHGDIRLSVTEFLPHASGEIQVREGEGLANPALKLSLQGSRATVHEWIFSREWERQRLVLGPASVTYLELPDLATFQRVLRENQLRGPVLWLPGSLIPLGEGLPRALEAGPWKGILQAYFPHAGVSETGIVNLSTDPVNPALRLTLIRPSATENYTLFSRFPELPTRDQEGPGAALPMRLLWVSPDLGSQPNELVLAHLQDGSLRYALRSGGVWKDPGLYTPGREVETGWMDFRFSITEIIRRARVSKVYRRVPVPSGQEGPPSAIRLAIEAPQGSEEFWLGRGEERSLALGSRDLRVAYGLKSRPLGFELRLEDFQMGTYEGTNDPSSYQSRVSVLDPGQPSRGEYLIQMNQPLKYGRYKIFQASYQLNPGGPDWSVLAVAYDPGIYLKYAGALIMVSGILLMFFFRPLFLQKRSAVSPALQEKAEARPPTAILSPSTGSSS